MWIKAWKSAWTWERESPEEAVCNTWYAQLDDLGAHRTARV